MSLFVTLSILIKGIPETLVVDYVNINIVSDFTEIRSTISGKVKKIKPVLHCEISGSDSGKYENDRNWVVFILLWFVMVILLYPPHSAGMQCCTRG
jgi:AICAR transformylase/IMP cyclohydrolase PurH